MRCQKCESEPFEVMVKDEMGFATESIELDQPATHCPFCGHSLNKAVSSRYDSKQDTFVPFDGVTYTKYNTYTNNDYWIDEIIDLITKWGDERKITKNGKPITQAIKTLEECHELLEAVNRNDKEEIIDAIGDIIVTLTMQCALQKIRLYDCILSAYDEIKDRTGHLNEVGDYIRDK